MGDKTYHETLDENQAEQEAVIAAELPLPKRAEHIKSGGSYRIIGTARMQVSDWCKFTTEINEGEGREYPIPGKSVDMVEVVVYESEADGTRWVRPYPEFMDGRFQPLEPLPELPMFGIDLARIQKAIISASDWEMTEADGHALEAAEQLAGITTIDDDATVCIATQEQIVKLMTEIRDHTREGVRRYYDSADVKELVKARVEAATIGGNISPDDASKIALEAAALAVRERVEVFKVNEYIDDEVATLMTRFDGIPHWQEQKFIEQEVGELARESALRVVFDKVTLINNLSKHCHGASAAAGWWTDIKTGESLIETRNKGELLMLMVSELAEVMEAVRKNLPSDKIPGFSGEEEEMADLLVRAFDYAGARKLRLGEAFVAKMEYNLNREDHKIENRRKPDGKQF